MVTILSHANCTDGLIAAYFPWKWFKINNIECEVIFCNYSKPIPDVKFDNILIVDFSYKPEIIDELCSSGKNVVMLDHHQSAADMFGGYTNLNTKCYDNGKLFTSRILKEHSGAGLSYLCVCEQVPTYGYEKPVTIDLVKIFGLEEKTLFNLPTWFINHHLSINYDRLRKIYQRTEDRDLWRFDYDDTNVYYELINSFEKSMEAVDKIIMMSKEDWEKELVKASAKV